MDNTAPTQQPATPQAPVINQPMVTPPPQAPSVKASSSMGRTLAMIISAVIIVLVLLVSGYLLLFSKSQMTHNAQVYNQPTTTPIATPTPTTYQVNVKDTSDSAIEQDTQATSQSLSNIDADLNNVDQSFNDQPTNLQ